MFLDISLLLLGFVFLIKGANWLVDGASALAKKHNISDLAIGLTIVAFGTSAPELVVNAIASFQGHQDIVLGNVIGSNNFNLFIILGIAGLIYPMTVQSSTVWKEIPISFFAAVLLLFLANDFFSDDTAVISRLDGGLLLLLFLGFLTYVFVQLKSDSRNLEVPTNQFSNLKITTYIILGLTGLVLGGKFVVSSATDIATSLGLSEKLIGLTIVAAGTSLPELATSVVAALKKNNDIAIGNIIGSNIFNIFFILSISSLIHPIEYNAIFNTDVFILLGGTLFLFAAMFTGRKRELDRWESALLLIAYVGYIAYTITKI
ncbi:MAG: sodium:proton exchanger [Cytophagales bacterium CG12_big_fil_rev_8_21_14_0_65_40_12]|nr:MAG: sodium:proton exchanger [Cytophagales bacterium CG12_big_fil_rev_8_21_14_0_65_40_12]PIW05517.1 MAG: sodium:proton exchanger [Cytophagales bacterium CG17_big_fil_post_rev_8_21_14_2_50_40_13]